MAGGEQIDGDMRALWERVKLLGNENDALRGTVNDLRLRVEALERQAQDRIADTGSHGDGE